MTLACYCRLRSAGAKADFRGFDLLFLLLLIHIKDPTAIGSPGKLLREHPRQLRQHGQLTVESQTVARPRYRGSIVVQVPGCRRSGQNRHALSLEPETITRLGHSSLESSAAHRRPSRRADRRCLTGCARRLTTSDALLLSLPSLRCI